MNGNRVSTSCTYRFLYVYIYARYWAGPWRSQGQVESLKMRSRFPMIVHACAGGLMKPSILVRFGSKWLWKASSFGSLDCVTHGHSHGPDP